MIIITLLSSLALASIAAWFSIAGLVALFSGNAIASISMGVVIELGKLVGISWLYRNWNKGPWFKWPMAATVVVALLVTSIGIFGFLSKSHLDHGAPVESTANQIAIIDAKIVREEEKKTRYLGDIASNKVVLDQLDAQVASLIANNKISDPKKGARVVREGQKEERAMLAANIEQSNLKIDAVQETIGKLNEEKLVLSLNVKNIEREVGPVKYVAAVFYDDPAANTDKAVRILILLVMIAFDPLAVLLLMGANHSIMQRSRNVLPVPVMTQESIISEEHITEESPTEVTQHDEPVVEVESELERFLAHNAAMKQRAIELESESVQQYNEIINTSPVDEVVEQVIEQEPVEPVEPIVEVNQPVAQTLVPEPYIPPHPVPMDLLGYNSVFSNSGVPANQKGRIVQQRIEDLHNKS